MNKLKPGATVRLSLDDELRAAVDAARRRHRAPRTAYLRNALLSTLQAEGHLTATAEPSR